MIVKVWSSKLLLNGKAQIEVWKTREGFHYLLKFANPQHKIEGFIVYETVMEAILAAHFHLIEA